MLDLFIEQPYVGTHPSEALEKEKGHLYKRINNDKVAPDGVKALSALGIALYLVRQLQREHEHRQKEIGKVNVCAGGILCRENKIVLGKRSADRSFYPRVWDIIGGHVVSNETPEQTLIRELKEELDVIATEWKLLTVLLDQEPGLNEQYSYYIYVVNDWLGSPRNILIDEHDALGWFEISEALQLDLALSGYAEVFRRLADEIPAR